MSLCQHTITRANSRAEIAREYLGKQAARLQRAVDRDSPASVHAVTRDIVRYSLDYVQASAFLNGLTEL